MITKTIFWKQGDRLRFTTDITIFKKGETATIAEIRPGKLKGHTDLVLQLNAKYRIELDMDAYADALELLL